MYLLLLLFTIYRVQQKDLKLRYTRYIYIFHWYQKASLSYYYFFFLRNLYGLKKYINKNKIFGKKGEISKTYRPNTRGVGLRINKDYITGGLLLLCTCKNKSDFPASRGPSANQLSERDQIPG